MWLAAMVLSGLYFIMSVIDIKAYILPDRLTYGSAILALPASIWIFNNDPVNVLWGGLIGAGLFWAVGIFYMKYRGVEGLGLGDVKLMLSVGFLSTAELLPLTMIVAGMAALAAFGVLSVSGKVNTALLERRLPFGPCLCLAGWIALLFGDGMWQWWLDFILR